MKAIDEAYEFMPYDMFNALFDKNRNMKIYYHDSPSFRAYYRPGNNEIHLGILNGRVTIAHETAHAIDDLWSGSRHATGGMWSDATRFVSETEGQVYRKWFTSHHKGVKLKYHNGDGYYYEDNWIHNYEGRIYVGGYPQNTGVEWFSMNVQRYADYRAYLATPKKQLLQEITERFELWGNITPKEYVYYKKNLHKFAEEVSEWSDVKSRYTHFAKFIEDKFGKNFASSKNIAAFPPKAVGKASRKLVGSPPKNKPMAAIKGKAACLLPSLLTTNKPQSCNDYIRKEGKWFLKGKQVSGAITEKLKAMRIPPAWRNVVVAKKTTDKIQAIGLDKAGRWQYRYSAGHIAKAAMEKFNRVKLFSRDLPSIRRAMKQGVNSGDPRAMLLRLEDKTAIRAGSTTDFKAKKKAYGLTTLLHEHVTIEGNVIKLDFIAKEGIRVKYTLTDDILAPFLAERKALTIAGEQLFPDVSASQLNAYIKEIAGGKKYTVKDFRTYHATRIAREELEKIENPIGLTAKSKKEVIANVCEKVSSFLKNTPVMAKKSYINPMVWDIIGGIE